MHGWVPTKFRRHGIPSTRNSVDTEFRQYGNPSTRNSVDNRIPSTRNSLVDTEFPRGHGIPPSTQNSPVDTEFPRRHGIQSTRNSVDTVFCQHQIPPTQNSAYILFTCVYLVCYAILFIFVPYMEFRGIPRDFADLKRQSLQYVSI
jgi:hypothetical protein